MAGVRTDEPVAAVVEVLDDVEVEELSGVLLEDPPGRSEGDSREELVVGPPLGLEPSRWRTPPWTT